MNLLKITRREGIGVRIWYIIIIEFAVFIDMERRLYTQRTYLILALI